MSTHLLGERPSSRLHESNLLHHGHTMIKCSKWLRQKNLTHFDSQKCVQLCTWPTHLLLHLRHPALQLLRLRLEGAHHLAGGGLRLGHGLQHQLLRGHGQAALQLLHRGRQRLQQRRALRLRQRRRLQRHLHLHRRRRLGLACFAPLFGALNMVVNAADNAYCMTNLLT
ncbi:Protein of unknown function [Gryllus bimaculatus]|nr:Protein of unknown function [Gryllus bimaculatus]